MRLQNAPSRQRTCRLPGFRTCLVIAALGLIGALIVSSSHHLSNLAIDASNRIAVSGTVHYLGQPLPRGKILFRVQIVDPQYEFVDAEATIDNGKFSIAKKNGPEPGWFLVTFVPDPEPYDGWRIGSTYALFEPHDNGVMRTAMKNRILLHIRPERRSEYHFELN